MKLKYIELGKEEIIKLIKGSKISFNDNNENSETIIFSNLTIDEIKQIRKNL